MSLRFFHSLAREYLSGKSVSGKKVKWQFYVSMIRLSGQY
jgi:hypothetical protein